MSFSVTKTFGHDVGLSCCFRQWRSKSHCSKLHGYAIAVTLIFKSDSLDESNWVVDFGGLKDVKQYLIDTFDHKTLIARDDPEYQTFIDLSKKDMVDLVVLDHVGCEMFAKTIFTNVSAWLDSKYGSQVRVSLFSVEVREHGANSATYTNPAKE